ncbi:SH3 domain-containing protein [Devosia sp.]|uniref:SH3 domain-containing protein n=1 Tax=Devosia sp. TaxID=1871048 RepID=UPI003A909C64
MSSTKTIAAAMAITAFGATGALAAQSTTTLNVRSGPSTGYSVVDTLYAGEQVNVEQCRSNGWCQITHPGPDGWVSSRYLTNVNEGRNRDRNRRRDRNNNNEPDVSISFGVPGFSFSIGNGGEFRQRPGRYGGRVCFYKDYNYRGDSFCVRPGQRDRSLSRYWNDSISSIRIRGDAQVQVCEDFNYGGRCAVLDRSRPALRGRNNDIISSYRVR